MAETIRVGAIAIRFLVESDDSGGSATVFECTIPAGARTPAPHSHDGFEETVYGLEGVATYTVDGQRVELGPGEALCIRRGAVHVFDNEGAEDAKLLVIASPGVFGPDYFREIGGALARANGGPPDQAEVGEIMRRHGLTPAG
jgi:quercetin dioxygenase-like cupin family protein